MSEWITLNIVSYRIVSNTHWAEALLVSSRGDSPGGPSCPTALVAPWSEPSRIRRGSGDGCDSVAASTVSVLRWRSSVDEQPRSNRFNCSSSSVGDLLSLDIRYNINRCKRIAIYTVSTKKTKSLAWFYLGLIKSITFGGLIRGSTQDTTGVAFPTKVRNLHNTLTWDVYFDEVL